MPSVVTLNLDYYLDKHGPWDKRRELVRAALKYTGAEVVVLQAVALDPAFDRRDQASQLAELLPDYTFCHFQPVGKTLDDREEERLTGLAILSKTAPDEVHFVPMGTRPNSADPTARILLHAHFNDPEVGLLNVFNVQFSPFYDQAYDNLRETLAYANVFTEPGLIIGDFNQPGNSPAVQDLLAAGWSDAWMLLNDNDTGYTFEADEPTVRFDQAWSKGLDIRRARTVTHYLGDLRMSSHLGLQIGW